MHWTEFFGGCESLGALGAVWMAFYISRRNRKDATHDKRWDLMAADVKQNREDTAELRVQMARELGGNSGGLRQTVDEMKKVLFELVGEFKQAMRGDE